MAIKENRRIKVQPKYVPRKDNTVWVDRTYNIKVPFIRLEGKWLQECGFEPDSHINIHCEKGKLTITPAAENAD